MSAVVRFVVEQGGCCARADLVRATSRTAVRRALEAGELVAPGHGRIALPGLDEAVVAAYGLRGVLCLASAALWHGWAVKTVPPRPQLAVRRGRRLTPEQRRGVSLHRVDLHPDDVTAGICTSVDRTLEDCLRLLPEDEALAVADSALRSGVAHAALLRVARGARGPGAPQARRVAQLADERAANPFESVLRHLALQVPGLRVQPQRVVLGTRQEARPDLVDVDLGLVLEADSFEWHGGRKSLVKDARRYNLLVVDGWLVLRFSWEDVMLDPDYVLDVLGAVTRMRTRSRSCPECGP